MHIFTLEIDILKLLSYISAFIITFSFLSCEEVITIDYIDVQRYVVVNSTFNPNEEFEIQLNYSSNRLDNSKLPTFIDDADVKIYNDKGNFLLDFYHAGEGRYVTVDQTRPFENQEYRLEVKVEGYRTIKSQSRIPPKAIVENITTLDVGKDGEAALKVDFDIKDAEDSDNYYIWELSDSNPEAGTKVTSPVQTVGPSDPLQNNGTWSKLFVQETDLNESISFLSFAQESNSDIESQTNPTPSEEVYLNVISASPDYYKYLLSLEIYNNDKDVYANSASTLAIELHSNIENGKGIFAGFNQETHLINIQ